MFFPYTPLGLAVGSYQLTYSASQVVGYTCVSSATSVINVTAAQLNFTVTGILTTLVSNNSLMRLSDFYIVL